MSVVQSDDEMEEIRFSQVRRRLFFEVGSSDAGCDPKLKRVKFRLQFAGIKLVGYIVPKLEAFKSSFHQHGFLQKK